MYTEELVLGTISLISILLALAFILYCIIIAATGKPIKLVGM